MATKYLDSTGLSTVWGKIKALIPQPASTSSQNPVMDGTAAIGSSNNYARADHVHPTDTSRVPTTRKVNGKALSSDVTLTGNDITVSSSDSTKIATVLGTSLTMVTLIDDVGEQIDLSSEDYSVEILGGNGIEVLATTTSGVQGTPSLVIKGINASSISDGLMVKADKSKLDSITMTNGKIDASILPSYVDDVIEAYPRSGQTALSSTWLSATSGGSALTPETGKIYILMATSGNYAVNSQFRWSGSTYVLLSDASGISAMTESEINAICV